MRPGSKWFKDQLTDSQESKSAGLGGRFSWPSQCIGGLQYTYVVLFSFRY